MQDIVLLCSNKSTKFSYDYLKKKSFSRSEDIAQCWDAAQGLHSTLRVKKKSLLKMYILLLWPSFPKIDNITTFHLVCMLY